MEFIDAKMNPNFTPKMLLKRSMRGPLKVKKDGLKRPKNRTRGATIWQGHATPHGQAVPLLWPAGRVGSWVHGPCVQFPPVFPPVSRVLSAALLFLVLGASSIL